MGRWTSAIFAVVLSGCSLFTNSDDFTFGSPPPPLPSGEVGGVIACSVVTPCPELANATTLCLDDECRVTCRVGYADCDEIPGNGCEVDLWASRFHCGTCGNNCNKNNTRGGQCVEGICELLCLGTWGDCDGEVDNGCEIDLLRNQNCGGCGIACGARQSCVEGTCCTEPCED